MIESPKFDDEDIAQISLIKRYRTQDSNGNQTKYSFCKIGLHKDISIELKGWISNNFNAIKSKKLSDYNPSVELEDLELVNLKEIEAWENFDERAFSGINFSEVDLKKESSNFVGIIIYVKKDKEVWGQIKRIQKGNVLHRKGQYILYFDKNKFNDLREEKGIRFDKNFDVLFHSNEKVSKGVIFDKTNFKALFDLWEEDKKKSLENVKKIKLFQQSKYGELIHEITESDRVVQKMLRNTAFESYLNDLTYVDLKELKKDVPELNFDLDPKTEDFILPIGNEKEAMKDLIKIICGRYNYSLNKKQVIENSGVRRVLKTQR